MASEQVKNQTREFIKELIRKHVKDQTPNDQGNRVFFIHWPFWHHKMVEAGSHIRENFDEVFGEMLSEGLFTKSEKDNTYILTEDNYEKIMGLSD